MYSPSKYWLLGWLLCVSCSLFAQQFGTTSNCYENLEAEGLQYLENNEYNRAINSFFSAYRCTDRPRDHKIDDHMQAVINKLKGIAQAAEVAKNEAVAARQAEAEAKEEAIKSAEVAARIARQAESLRLALLADLEREKQAYRTALQLAYLSLKLSNQDNYNNALTAFAKVVRDSFARQLPAGAGLKNIQSHAGYLLVENDAGLTIWDETGWTPIAQLNNIEHYIPIPGLPQFIFSSPGSNTLKMYFIPQQQEVQLNAQHGERLTYASTTQDGYLTSARDDLSIIWNKQGQLQTTLAGHEGNIYEHLYWDTNNSIITRSSDGKLKRWSDQGEWLSDLAEGYYFHDIELSPKGDILLAADAQGRISLWRKGQKDEEVIVLKHGVTPINKVRFFSTGDPIFVSHDIKGQIKLWQINESTTPIVIDSLPAIRDFILLGNPNEILAWSKTGQCYLISPDGNLQNSWSVPEGNISGVAYAPRIDALLSTSQGDRQYIRWWSRQGKQLLQWETMVVDENWPGFFSTHEHYIVIPNTGREVISVYPLPSEKLAELEQQTDLIDKELLGEFNIQVWPDN